MAFRLSMSHFPNPDFLAVSIADSLKFTPTLIHSRNTTASSTLRPNFYRHCVAGVFPTRQKIGNFVGFLFCIKFVRFNDTIKLLFMQCVLIGLEGVVTSLLVFFPVSPLVFNAAVPLYFAAMTTTATTIWEDSERYYKNCAHIEKPSRGFVSYHREHRLVAGCWQTPHRFVVAVDIVDLDYSDWVFCRSRRSKEQW